ncbi:hypothetical protein IAE30_20210 [Pantoea sp. S61]|uniref:DUF6201 family protein n=1 Tax=Pantoea sp. S61 TaxID=2767442 RepID=UPI00190DB997|nr:hypothetical protein [Pantoea sp. S61]
MKAINCKYIWRFLFVLVVTLFFFSPSSFFYGDFNEKYRMLSPDKKYEVVIYKYIPVSIYSIYEAFDDNGYFFAVYDSCGHEVYKPPFYYGVSSSLIYGDMSFSTLNKRELFFPTNEGIDSVELKKTSDKCVSE